MWEGGIRCANGCVMICQWHGCLIVVSTDKVHGPQNAWQHSTMKSLISFKIEPTDRHLKRSTARLIGIACDSPYMRSSTYSGYLAKRTLQFLSHRDKSCTTMESLGPCVNTSRRTSEPWPHLYTSCSEEKGCMDKMRLHGDVGMTECMQPR